MPESTADVLADLERLRERAENAYRTAIHAKLSALNARYKRHRIKTFSGMGSTFFIVDPPFLGEPHISPFDSRYPPNGGRTLTEEFYMLLNEIIELYEECEQEFGFDLGDVDPSQPLA